MAGLVGVAIVGVRGGSGGARESAVRDDEGERGGE
jgi:hypothetical protein